VNKFYETDPANLHKLLKDAVPRWDESAFGSGSYAQDDLNNGHQSTQSTPTSTAARPMWTDNHDH
jgi:hypothetical protein